MPEKIAKSILFFNLILLTTQIYGQDHKYPLVHEEQFHAPLYENENSRILSVKAQKGDTTDFHRHCHPIVYITLSGTTVELNEPNDTWNKVHLPTNWIGHDLYNQDSCFTHRFAISGENDLHIIAVEGLNSSDIYKTDIIPIYKEGGFTIYSLNAKNFTYFTSKKWPVVVAESWEGEYNIRIADSDTLTESDLQNSRAYLVVFKNEQITIDGE
jgi:hypothetical protein